MKQFYITSFLFLVIANLLYPINAKAEVGLKEFYTDGCTMFIDNYPKSKEKSWRHCCVIHDLRYWYGGNENEKNQADLDLKACVSEAYSKYLGAIMYNAIRLGSKSPVKHETFWGWGWIEKKSSYFDLTDQELQYVKTIFETLELKEDKVSIPEFIKKYLSK